jgi:uridylate kinase
MRYKRILLKLSGEALMGNDSFGISPKSLKNYVEEIIAIHKEGIQIGIVVGGGNFFRGIQSKQTGIKKVSGDKMGMLATMINAIALRDAIENMGVKARVQTSIFIPQISEIFIKEKAVKHFSKNRICIFAGGTGNPFFTTDSAAALRAAEIEANILIKATNVDGVFDVDPKKNPNAKLFDTVTFSECIEKKLAVMDLTAFTLCSENNIHIGVLNLHKKGNLLKFLKGEKIGTIIK